MEGLIDGLVEGFIDWFIDWLHVDGFIDRFVKLGFHGWLHRRGFMDGFIWWGFMDVASLMGFHGCGFSIEGVFHGWLQLMGFYGWLYRRAFMDGFIDGSMGFHGCGLHGWLQLTGFMDVVSCGWGFIDRVSWMASLTGFYWCGVVDGMFLGWLDGFITASSKCGFVEVVVVDYMMDDDTVNDGCGVLAAVLSCVQKRGFSARRSTNSTLCALHAYIQLLRKNTALTAALLLFFFVVLRVDNSSGSHTTQPCCLCCGGSPQYTFALHARTEPLRKNTGLTVALLFFFVVLRADT
jgi:hypothetical protein